MEENEKKLEGLEGKELEEKEFVIERIIKYNEEINIAERKAIGYAFIAGLLGMMTIMNFNYLPISPDDHLLLFAMSGIGSAISISSSVILVINNFLKKTGLEISKRNLQDKYFIDDEEIAFTLGKTKGKHC